MHTANSFKCAKPALWLAIAIQAIWPLQNALGAATVISDQPIFVTNNVPPNMMLALSVEWPTGVVGAYKDNTITYNATTFDAAYVDSAATRYVGYFDPTFCYKYYTSNGATLNNKPATPNTGTRTAAEAAGEYFRPVAKGTGASGKQCDGSAFSGNFLNWASAHALDGFRFSMTGGDRVIDTSTKTVVEKSRHTGQGGYAQFPIKNGTAARGVVAPFGTGAADDWDNLFVRVHSNGTELNPFNDSSTRGRVIQISNKSDFPAHNGTTNLTYTYLVRVQVCDSSHATSALKFEYSSDGDFNSCLGYPVGSASPTVYKPVGLIQKNSEKMRFGATGYLLDSADARAGGVLRARMKSVGPNLVVANGPAIANANAEWSAATGVYVSNPDSADATASGVTNSGVVNYLNKFGKLSTSNFKSKDPFSELYYSALRSLRNMTPVPEYVSGLTAAMYDGFPVITTTVSEPSAPFTPGNLAPLPIQYSCQQNNLVGIADTNCHTDVFTPGNTLAGYAGHPTTGLVDNDPVNAANDINVVTLGNTIGSLEFSPSKNLGTTYQGGGGRKNTFHIASLAYWANTKDMLPDDAAKPWTTGKQQAKSYFVDVRENGSDGMVNNQMWLAAKYGGFDDRNNNGIPATLDTWHTNSDVFTTSTTNQPGQTTKDFAAGQTNLRGARPDNYFTGDSPQKLFDSLSAIFNSALARSLSGAGASISTINFQASTTGNGAYTVQYNAKDWTGDIKGNQITVDNTGTPTVTNMWSAQAKLDDQISNGGLNNGWDVVRKIVTFVPGTGGGTFRWASLNATQKAHLQNTSSLLEYLRGKKCHEVGNALSAGCSDSPAHQGLYRARNHMLGDIISSEATSVGAPDGSYTGLSGYPAFVTKFTTTTPRKRVLYAGANDGMVHAFDADVGSPGSTSPATAAVAPGAGAGTELWAYVPNMVLAGPTLPTPDPMTDGLASRGKATAFTHKYHVDQTPFARDIDFEDTLGASPSCTSPGSTGCSWRTILVGGLGKGGRGYYALDVTNPSDWSNEAAVAGKVLWEFTDEDMGYSFGRPVIVRTQRDGWVVILSSGYNNTYGTDTTHRGKGFLFIVNAKTGALIEKISTGVGSEVSPSGFARPAAFIPDSATYLTDYVYGGDLDGNVWRFDLRGTPTSYPTPTKIAKLTSDGSDGTSDPTVNQPVTVQPKIEIGQNGINRWVFIGTGKLLSPADMGSSQQQSFYAIRDGSRTKVYGTDTNQTALPSGASFPVTRNKLVSNTNLLTGFLEDPSKPMGWFYDLHASEKITTPLVANEGLISWNGYLPTTDACAPGAASNVYVTDYDSGKTRLTLNGANIDYFSSSTYLVKLQFIKDSGGKIRAVITKGDPTGGSQIIKADGQFGRVAGVPVRVNWREIQR
ncbi:MAG: PilC/PilY family type IV pilus protein [Rhodocyclaceae bacterium]|nr:PilC/PilY family type IV pilus protein [Rhodocyclaceae bacterium]